MSSEHPKLEGMFAVHKIALDTYLHFTGALQLVIDGEPDDDNEHVRKLLFALSMTETFWQEFQARYDERLWKTKEEVADV